MNKSELIEHVAKNADLSKAAASRALDATIDGITRAMRRGDDVALLGFGTFKVVKRDARVGRNPRTGGELKIKARKAPVFKPSSVLKAKLN